VSIVASICHFYQSPGWDQQYLQLSHVKNNLAGWFANSRRGSIRFWSAGSDP